MSNQTGRRSSVLPSPIKFGDGNAKLSLEGRNPDGSLKLRVKVPGLLGKYTLNRGENTRPLQFEGEVIVAVESAADPGRVHGDLKRLARIYRAAIYKTRGGKYVTEFSSRENVGIFNSGEGWESKVEVFDTLDAACDWFRPGPLTTELLKKLGKWGPEIIE